MLKDKLRGGRACLGAWIRGTAPENAAVLAASGLDFLVLDPVQGQGDLKDAIAQLRAIKATDCAGLVRVQAGDLDGVRNALAGGAAGIMVANVGSARDADAVVSAWPKADARVVVAVELDNAAGIDCIDAICAVDGVDLIFIGAQDPSALKRAEQAVRRSGKLLGSTAADGKAAARMIASGHALVVAGSDTTLLGSAAASMLAEARAAEALPIPAALPSPPRLHSDWTTTTSIRRMRRFWMAWCVAVLLLGIAVVGFGYLFSISEDWWVGYKIGGRILAGLIAAWAIYDAHRMAVHGTLALQEVLAQNLATMVTTELERLKAATDARRRSLAAKGAGVVADLGDAERIDLELPTCRFDNEGVRTLLGNPTEQALGAVLEAIEEYNRLIHASRDRALSQSELAHRIDGVFDSVNLAMASVVGGPNVAAGKSLSMSH